MIQSEPKACESGDFRRKPGAESKAWKPAVLFCPRAEEDGDLSKRRECKGQFTLLLPFCSIWVLSGLDDVYPVWRACALRGSPIKMLISSGNTLKIHSEIMFHQLYGYLLAKASWRIQWTITIPQELMLMLRNGNTHFCQGQSETFATDFPNRWAPSQWQHLFSDHKTISVLWLQAWTQMCVYEDKKGYNT